MPEFNDVILSVAALFLLAWVIYLKWQISSMIEQNKKMAGFLKDKVGKIQKDVEVQGADAVYGHKPSWLK